MPKQTINLTPDPRILRMLGQIELKGWQCVAELIDNSIDSMMKMGTNSERNYIEVYIPTPSEVRRDEPLKIIDNGIGMNSEELENCLRAGYTSRNIDNLGLFGMGFNIATARLGDVVEVWTSKSDMDFDIGVKIDLLEMQSSGNFDREVMKRPKALKPSGTAILISSYHNRAGKLLNRSHIIKELNRTYSKTLIEDYNINIIINDESIKPFEFCVWDESRSVKYKGEDIYAIQPLEFHLGEKRFCSRCFTWLDDVKHDTGNPVACPHCNSHDQISTKNVEIKGWLGIQRYNDLNHFGFNIIRNGRIIKKLDKSLFTWQDRHDKNNGEPIFEYPIDTTAQGGRIVGEIIADFITPTYTKDSFEDTDTLWLNAVEYIRGVEPLQPNKAQDLGFGKNKSPLAKLFYGYRRSSPAGKTHLIPGKSDGTGAYQLARDWAQRFYEGDPQFQTDKIWYQAVEEAELGPVRPGNKKRDPTRPGDWAPPAGGSYPTQSDTSHDSSPEDPQTESLFPGKKTLVSVKKFDLENLINEKPISVTILDYWPTVNIEKPIIFDPNGPPNHFKVYINNCHLLYKDFADGWYDLLLMEVATKFYEKLDNVDKWPVSRLYYELKIKYAGDTMLNVDELIKSSKSLIKDIQNFLTSEKGEHELSPLPDLTPEEIKSLTNNFITSESQSPNIPRLLRTPKFIKYLDIKYIPNFIERFPELILDNNFFSIPYTDIEIQEIKDRQLQRFINYLSDLKWFIYELSELPDDAIKAQKNLIIRNRISLEYLNNART